MSKVSEMKPWLSSCHERFNTSHQIFDKKCTVVWPTDHLMMFATLGDDVILPCSIPDIKSCSSMNWTKAGAFGSVSEVVRAGRVMPSNTLRLILQWDCSLKISQMIPDDARIYTCSNGALNASVSLHILERK